MDWVIDASEVGANQSAAYTIRIGRALLAQPLLNQGRKMTSDVIQDRGRGPEIAGTRITVYNLLQSFLDPIVTEEEICRVYDLTARQVAAARAYVLSNPETVLAEHLKIEERMAAGNPPQVRERAERAMSTFQSFKRWLAERDATNAEEGTEERPGRFPTFREWLAGREGR
jgi:uncharacterized protein (DUF433 family)